MAQLRIFGSIAAGGIVVVGESHPHLDAGFWDKQEAVRDSTDDVWEADHINDHIQQ